MLQLEVFILKLGAVNTLATGSIAACKVSTLAHELGNDPVPTEPMIIQHVHRWTKDHLPMKLGVFVPKPFLTGTQGTEIFRGFRNDIGEQLET